MTQVQNLIVSSLLFQKEKYLFFILFLFFNSKQKAKHTNLKKRS